MTDFRARTSRGARIGFCNLLCGLGLVLALLTAAGCGTTTFTPGTPVVTISAKPGRFVSYIVTLFQITLTRSDGNTAVLPVNSQPVDLAHLDRYVSLMQAPPVEVGTYVSATLLLDYSAANIQVDIGGQATQTTVVDPALAAGTAPGLITATVQFDPKHPLVINNPNSALLAFDIDLEASNVVTYNTTAAAWQTTVKPFWTATTVPAYDKPIFARGIFVNADTKNNTFGMNTRPFHYEANITFGALHVNVNDQTYYQINGNTYVGASGLAALAALQTAFSDMPIAAYGPNTPSPFGSLNTITPSMTATQVYVGSSLESTIEEQISGIVSAVSGNTLTVMNAAFVDRTGTAYISQPTNTVTVGPNTVISIDGLDVQPNIQSISVGQFISVTGQGLDPNTALPTTTLDATGNNVPGAQVRLQNTTLWGSLNSASPGTLFLNLKYMENTETTAGPLATAIPTASNYQVATGSMDESATAANTLLKVDGLATPVNTGPPYFTASAITTPTNSQLVLEWPAGTTAAFTTINGAGIIINTADPALTTAELRMGPVTTGNLLTQQPPASLLKLTYNSTDPANPPLYGTGSVALGESWYSDPNDFAAKAASVATNPVYKLVATGQYDPVGGTFNATNVIMNAK